MFHLSTCVLIMDTEMTKEMEGEERRSEHSCHIVAYRDSNADSTAQYETALVNLTVSVGIRPI